MHNPLTKDDLDNLPMIEEGVKGIINEIISDELGSDDADIKVRALRGYLAGLYLDCDYDDVETDGIKDDLEESASGFCDGWIYCMEYGVSERLWKGS